MDSQQSKKGKQMIFNVKDKTKKQTIFCRFSIDYKDLLTEFSKSFNIVVIPKNTFRKLEKLVKNEKAREIVEKVKIMMRFYGGI